MRITALLILVSLGCAFQDAKAQDVVCAPCDTFVTNGLYTTFTIDASKTREENAKAWLCRDDFAQRYESGGGGGEVSILYGLISGGGKGGGSEFSEERSKFCADNTRQLSAADVTRLYAHFPNTAGYAAWSTCIRECYQSSAPRLSDVHGEYQFTDLGFTLTLTWRQVSTSDRLFVTGASATGAVCEWAPVLQFGSPLGAATASTTCRWLATDNPAGSVLVNTTRGSWATAVRDWRRTRAAEITWGYNITSWNWVNSDEKTCTTIALPDNAHHDWKDRGKYKDTCNEQVTRWCAAVRTGTLRAPSGRRFRSVEGPYIIEGPGTHWSTKFAGIENGGSTARAVVNGWTHPQKLRFCAFHQELKSRPDFIAGAPKTVYWDTPFVLEVPRVATSALVGGRIFSGGREFRVQAGRGEPPLQYLGATTIGETTIYTYKLAHEQMP